MAGDWIPMRTDLWDCPEVVRILSAMCPDAVRDTSKAVRMKSEILGAMFRTWSLFDTYTDDGILDGYTSDTLDAVVGIQGWSANLQHVGWLLIEAQRLVMPKFDAWLSSSAKARLKDAQRKRNERKQASEDCPKSVRKSTDKNRTTVQNNTEQYLTSTSTSGADAKIELSEDDREDVSLECNRLVKLIGTSGANIDQQHKDRSLIFKTVMLARYVFGNEFLDSATEAMRQKIAAGAVTNRRAMFHGICKSLAEDKQRDFNRELKRVIEPSWIKTNGVKHDCAATN